MHDDKYKMIRENTYHEMKQLIDIFLENRKHEIYFFDENWNLLFVCKLAFHPIRLSKLKKVTSFSKNTRMHFMMSKMHTLSKNSKFSDILHFCNIANNTFLE